MNAVYLSTTGDTTTLLPTPLEVQGYGCGLIEISGKTIPRNENGNLYLCCNIVEESFVGSIKMPVLRFLKRSQSGNVNNAITHVIWLKVMRPTITSIRLYIADETGEAVSLPDTKVDCTLLFIPHTRHQDGSGLE